MGNGLKNSIDMEKQNEYQRIIKMIKTHDPVLKDKDKHVNDIMRQFITPQKGPSIISRFEEFLFDWANSFRWRLAMTLLSFLLIGLFFQQQIELSEKIGNLESHILQSEMYDEQDTKRGVMQKALLKMIKKERLVNDSIKVSKRDLELLIDDYLRLKIQKESEIDGSGEEQDIIEMEQDSSIEL